MAEPTNEEQLASEHASRVWERLTEKQRYTIRTIRFGETLRKCHKATLAALLRERLVWQPGLLESRGEYCATGWGHFVAFAPEREALRGPGPSAADIKRRAGIAP